MASSALEKHPLVPQCFLRDVKPLEVFCGSVESGGDLNYIGELVPAIAVMGRAELRQGWQMTISTSIREFKMPIRHEISGRAI